MERRNEIQNAYQLLGKEATLYDGMITCSTLLGKLICKLVWNMNQDKNTEYLNRVLSKIPEDFSGKMLEVPVGTGILTMPVYQSLTNADITCLDYSTDMMSKAQARAKRDAIANVQFVQGDIGKLPFADESFDIVMSLNGFHAFPDKEAAYREVYRVLKPGGMFCGCFYIEGQNKRTDWFIRHLYEPKGFFTPPYESLQTLEKRFIDSYENVEVSHVESIVCFSARKCER